MPKILFQQRFQAHTQWKARLGRTLEEYETWLGKQGLASRTNLERIQRGLEGLRGERPTIACVAEATRGKADLINALFFADAGRPLLPPGAGCPCEILWDNQRNEPYLRLLPIETRTQGGSLAQLRQDPRQWVQYPLDAQSPEQMARILGELLQTRRVDPAAALRLGLAPLALPVEGAGDALVEIPRWRHAIISFPHPLLRQGLVVLSIPGLHALEREPELHPCTLPSMSLVLFMLAADKGVTPADLALWERHFKEFQHRRPGNLVVALNQIDRLGAPSQGEPANVQAIAHQRTAIAQLLGLEEQPIFPISAHKALLARVQNNRCLLRRSALEDLDAYLVNHTLAAWEQHLLKRVRAEVGVLLENDLKRATQQVEAIRQQVHEVEALRNKSREVIQQLLDKTRRDQTQYLNSIARFQTGRGDLQRVALPLRDALDLDRLDRVIEQACQARLQSWTTRGARRVMENLFEALRQNMQAITSQSEQIRTLIQGIYEAFQNECGLNATPPPAFSSMKYRVALEFLYEEAEVHRRGRMLAMGERGRLVNQSFQHLVSQAREIFVSLKQELEQWLPQALRALADEIQAHKERMEKRLVNLQKIEESRHNLEGRIEALENQQAEHVYQLTALRNLHNGIYLSPPANNLEYPKPRLVAQRRGSP